VVGFRDALGFAADVTVSFAVERGLKGGSHGLVKELFVGAGAGAAGGAAGAWVTNGFSLNGDLGKGVLYGAVGGAAGAGLGRWWGNSLTKGKTAADEALTEADAVKRSTDEDGRLIDDAEAGLEAAETKLNNAEEALQRANSKVDDLRTEVDDLRNDLRADPDNDLLKEDLREARQRLRAAESQADSAQLDVDAARREADEAIERYNDADADWEGVEDAARNADEAFKKAEDAAEAAGKKLERFGDWYRGTLVGLGSAAGMALGIHGLPFSSDGSGGNQSDAGVNRISLVWDGYQPAADADLMGQPPFEKGSSPKDGEGFLLRPAELNPSIVAWYGGPSNSFAYSLVDAYKMFGDLKKKENLKVTPIPAMPSTVQNPTGVSSAGGASYRDKADALADAGKKLTATQQSVVSVLPTVEEISRRGKENIGRLIVGVNRFMVERLQTGSDIEFLTVLSQGFAELANEIKNAAEANTNAAGFVQTPTAEQDMAAAQNLANSVGGYAGQQYHPGLTPDSSQIGVNNPWDPGNLGTSPAATPDTSALKDASEKFRDQAENLAGSANTPSNLSPASYDPGAAFNPGASQLGSAGSMGAMGGMGGLMDMMLPLQLMAQQRAMREQMDNGMDGRMEELDPSRFDQAAVATMPQAQQPVGTTPWSNQAAANNAATPAQPAVHHPAGVPSGATSSQPSTAVPKRVPGDDGLVPYVFPEETQRVPLAVALALDKAFANKSGTDAQAAYQGTAGAWTDSKDIGPAVDPFQLATGDIGTWIIRQPKKESQQAEPVPAQAGNEAQIQPAAMVTVGGDTGEKKNEPETGSSGDPEYRTAILVVFGEGESGTLKAVVNGELQQFEAEMSDTGGDFGEFAGFKHPKGVEAAADKSQDSETMATSGDQTTADIPALTMPV
jgi:hypothetical protein